MESGRTEKRQYAIVPYAVHDGVPSFRDSEIEGWFVRMRDEKTLRWLFFDGAVVDGLELVRMVKAGGSFWFTVWTRKEEGGPPSLKSSGAARSGKAEEKKTELDMVGLFWLNNFMGTSAQLHHVIWKKFWGKETLAIGRAVLNFIFGVEEGIPIVSVLIGLTPANNIPALRFAKSLGLETVGRIPGVYYDIYENCAVDGIMRYMNREIWMALNKE